MAQIDLGKLKFQWKGLYTSATAYEVDDVVHYNGSTYVVKTAVPVSNTSDPGVSTSFDLMARGLKFRGAYTSSATYLHNEVVTYNSASWISTQSVSFTNQTPESGSAYWEVLTPAPSTSVLTTPGDLVYVAKDGVTSRLPVGSKGTTLTVVESPNQTFGRGFTYSVGTASPATAIATDIDSVLVVGTNVANANVTVTRGRSYTITFPANSKTYSIKNPAAGGYAALGTGGRLSSGVTPASITNGGTLQFSPDASTPNTVVVRDELGGLDVLTITVVNMPYAPSWQGSASQKATFAAFNRNYNTYTSSLLPNSQVGGTYFGRGLQNTISFDGYRKGSYLATNGKVYSWGNTYQNATQGYHYSCYGYGSDYNGVTSFPVQTQLRIPRWFNAAIAGDVNEAKWLTDLNGNSLGYTMNAVPKIIKYIGTSNSAHFLTENGIAFSSGYNGYGILGNGNTAITYLAAMPVQFYNSSSTALTGASRPKIVQFLSSAATDAVGTESTMMALDTNGVVYRWGLNSYGQLADGTTTNNYFARAIAQSFFNNEKVVYLYMGGGQTYTSCYAITETGKLYCWGYNTFGQLGLGDLVNKTQPFEATAITGSGILGKKVIHVIAVGGESSATKTLVLTSEGRVYAAGNGEAFGQYLGVYTSTSANITSFTEITNASTTYNSGNQKVVSLWTSGGRYPSWYAITDGGTANQPKVYSWGNNNTQQLGRNATAPSAPGSAAIQGDWFPGEILFSDYGDQELNGTPTNASRPNEIRGLGQYNASWTGKFKFGTPVAVLANGNGSVTTQAVVLLDSLGQVFVTGYWPTYNPSPYYEADNIADFEAAEDQNRYFSMIYNAPERIVDWMFTTFASDGQSYLAAGASGTVYGAGDNSWTSNGQPHAYSSRGFSPITQTIN